MTLRYSKSLLLIGFICFGLGCTDGDTFDPPNDMFVNPEAGPSMYVTRTELGATNYYDAYCVLTERPPLSSLQVSIITPVRDKEAQEDALESELLLKDQLPVPDTQPSAPAAQSKTPPDTQPSAPAAQSKTPPDTQPSASVVQSKTPPDTQPTAPPVQAKTPPETQPTAPPAAQTKTQPQTPLTITANKSSDFQWDGRKSVVKSVGFRPLLFRATFHTSKVHQHFSTWEVPALYLPNFQYGMVRLKPDDELKDYEQSSPYLTYDITTADKLSFKRQIKLAGSYDVAGGYGIIAGQSSGSANYSAEVNITSADPVFGVRFAVAATQLLRIDLNTPADQSSVLIFYSTVGAPVSASISQTVKNANSGSVAGVTKGSTDYEQLGAVDYSSRFVLFKYANADAVSTLVESATKSLQPKAKAKTSDPDEDAFRMFKKVKLSTHLEKNTSCIIIFEDQVLAQNTNFNPTNCTLPASAVAIVPRTSSVLLSKNCLRKIAPSWLRPINGGTLKNVPPTPVGYLEKDLTITDVLDAGKELLDLDVYVLSTPYLSHLQCEQVSLMHYGLGNNLGPTDPLPQRPTTHPTCPVAAVPATSQPVTPSTRPAQPSK